MQLEEGQETDESIFENLDSLIQGKSQKIIQGHFSFLKSCNIEIDELNKIALLCQAFTVEDFELINGLPPSILKMGIFWKHLLKKGEQSCSLVIKELTQNGHRQLVKTVISFNVKRNRCEFNKEFTREIIERNTSYICNELNLSSGIQDMLFEFDIISIDEHDDIDKQQSRPQKRKLLVELLLRKENTEQIPDFLQLLYMTGHAHILENIRSQLNRNKEFTMPRSSLITNAEVTLGHTEMSQPDTFLLRLQSQSQGVGSFDDVIITEEEMEDVLQEAINAEVVEIREGSIYFHLNSFSPDIIFNILRGNADDKIKLCLQMLFNRNKKLHTYFGKDDVIEFMLKEIPHNSFITDGKKKQPQRKEIVNSWCASCYQATLRQHYETVVGEIEDDIIQDTMDKLKEIRKDELFGSKKCFTEHTSRRYKAVSFLQYVLCNEDVLFAFEKAFSFRSQVRLDAIKCRKCKNENGEYLQLLEPKNRKYYFTVSLDASGVVLVNDATSTVSSPSHAFWNIADQPNIQRKLIRTLTLNEFPAFTAFEEYRLIVMDETTEPNNISFLDTTKFCTGNILQFYKFPSIKNNAINNEGEKKTIAHCVALTSPGPHAFVLITDVLKLIDLESTLKPYREYFGSNILNYLVVMFIKDGQFRFAPDEYIESSLQLHRLLKEGSQYIIFDNMSSEDRKYAQIKKFGKLIEGMFKRNQGQYFSNHIFAESERAIQIATKVKEKEKRLTIRRYEDEKDKRIKLLEDKLEQLRIEVDRIEDEKLQQIRHFDDRSKELKQKNSRSEAAEQVWSQHVIDEILSS